MNIPLAVIFRESTAAVLFICLFLLFPITLNVVLQEIDIWQLFVDFKSLFCEEAPLSSEFFFPVFCCYFNYF